MELNSNTLKGLALLESYTNFPERLEQVANRTSRWSSDKTIKDIAKKLIQELPPGTVDTPSYFRMEFGNLIRAKRIFSNKPSNTYFVYFYRLVYIVTHDRQIAKLVEYYEDAAHFGSPYSE